MKDTLFIGTLFLVAGWWLSAFGEDWLLYETWLQSSFEPVRLDEFVQAHRAQYNDDYFHCSREAQRLLRDEAKIRDRRYNFAGDSVQRDSCRRNNHFRGLDKHLADLDQAILNRTPWLDQEAGRKSATAVRAEEEFEKSCTAPACDIAKRKRSQLLQDLRPYLQCPPVLEHSSEIDPSFKTFTLPEDRGG